MVVLGGEGVWLADVYGGLTEGLALGLGLCVASRARSCPSGTLLSGIFLPGTLSKISPSLPFPRHFTFPPCFAPCHISALFIVYLSLTLLCVPGL